MLIIENICDRFHSHYMWLLSTNEFNKSIHVTAFYLILFYVNESTHFIHLDILMMIWKYVIEFFLKMISWLNVWPNMIIVIRYIYFKEILISPLISILTLLLRIEMSIWYFWSKFRKIIIIKTQFHYGFESIYKFSSHIQEIWMK